MYTLFIVNDNIISPPTFLTKDDVEGFAFSGIRKLQHACHGPLSSTSATLGLRRSTILLRTMLARIEERKFALRRRFCGKVDSYVTGYLKFYRDKFSSTIRLCAQFASSQQLAYVNVNEIDVSMSHHVTSLSTKTHKHTHTHTHKDTLLYITPTSQPRLECLYVIAVSFYFRLNPPLYNTTVARQRRPNSIDRDHKLRLSRFVDNECIS